MHGDKIFTRGQNCTEGHFWTKEEKMRKIIIKDKLIKRKKDYRPRVRVRGNSGSKKKKLIITNIKIKSKKLFTKKKKEKNKLLTEGKD